MFCERAGVQAMDKAFEAQVAKIASDMGITIDAVLNMLLEQFFKSTGSSCRPCEESEINLIEKPTKEFEAFCQETIKNRKDVAAFPHITDYDAERNAIVKIFADGGKEYVFL